MSVEIKGLNVRRGARSVIRDLDLNIPTGEILVVLGANGAGKSTLLETIAGDHPIAKGEVFFGECSLSDWSPRALAKRRGVLRQSPRLDLRFTVLEVVLMGRTPHIQRHETRTDLQIALAALSLVNLEGFADRLYPELSGGEQQRVHLARVLSQVWTPALMGQEIEPSTEPPYLLFDEPIANLDVHAQHLVLECITRFARVGGTVFCVLHDINLAAQYADNVLLLKDGQVLARGTPAEVLKPDLLLDAFQVNGTIVASEKIPHPIFVVGRKKE